jgi:hypothetical protein
MELTSLFLLVIVWCVAVGAVAALVVYWRRLRGRLLPVRVVAMLLCEILLIFGVALVVNRSGDFYPTWSALVGSSSTKDQSTDRRANLAPWLQSKAAEGARNGLAFPWRPDGVADWGLDRPPTIFLPTAYFRGPALSLPVIVMMAPPGVGTAHGGWEDQKIAAFGRASGVPAVMLFLRAGSRVRVHRLTADLPVRLAADLRVAQHGWAMIAVGAAVPDGLDVFDRDPDRFGPLALLPAGSTPLAEHLVQRAQRAAGTQLFIPGQPVGPTKEHPPASAASSAKPPPPGGAPKGPLAGGAQKAVPPGGAPKALTAAGAQTSPPPDGVRRTLSSLGHPNASPSGDPAKVPPPGGPPAGPDSEGLAAALRWAYRHLPPALAAPRELEPLPLPSATPSVPGKSDGRGSPSAPAGGARPVGS